jgi:hypothetical protein
MQAVCTDIHDGFLPFVYELKCEGWPRGKNWNQYPIHKPIRQEEWGIPPEGPGVQKLAPIQWPQLKPLPKSPGLVEQFKHIADLVDMAHRYLDPSSERLVWSILLGAGVSVVGLNVFLKNGGARLSPAALGAAIAAIVLVLEPSYDHFSPADKKRFDSIRKEVAWMDPGRIEIDEKHRRVFVDGIEIAVKESPSTSIQGDLAEAGEPLEDGDYSKGLMSGDDPVRLE